MEQNDELFITDLVTEDAKESLKKSKISKNIFMKSSGGFLFRKNTTLAKSSHKSGFSSVISE